MRNIVSTIIVALCLAAQPTVANDSGTGVKVIPIITSLLLEDAKYEDHFFVGRWEETSGDHSIFHFYADGRFVFWEFGCTSCRVDNTWEPISKYRALVKSTWTWEGVVHNSYRYAAFENGRTGWYRNVDGSFEGFITVFVPCQPAPPTYHLACY